MRKKILIMFMAIAWTVLLAGQDPFFSQFYASGLYLNPAFTGTSQLSRVSATYRNQSPGLGSPFVTCNASYDQPVEILGGGIGINISNDVQGPGILNRTSIDALYAYHLPVTSRITISAGFQASYGFRVLRTSDMILPDGLDPTGIYLGHLEPISDQNRGYPDFAVGFLAFNRYAYAGASMHHLTKPNMSLSKSQQHPLSRKLTLHGGMFFSLYEKRFGREALKLNPNLVYIHQAGFRQLNYGLDAVYRVVYAGVWLRHSIDFHLNALSFHFGYDHSYFRIGYSHDFNMMQPWKEMSNMGAHEISVLLKLGDKNGNRSSSRAIKCPKI